MSGSKSSQKAAQLISLSWNLKATVGQPIHHPLTKYEIMERLDATPLDKGGPYSIQRSQSRKSPCATPVWTLKVGLFRFMGDDQCEEFAN